MSETQETQTQLQFRTAAFGGFQKQDVLAYLEKSAKDQAEKLADLKRTLDREKAEKSEMEANISALEKRVSALVAENQRLATDLSQRESELEEARKGQEEQRERAEKLQAQVDKLAPAAAAYEGVKDRTAGIELEAHSRALAIEGEAHRKVKKTLEQAEDWFDKLQAAYGRLRTDLDATLAHAVGEMERAEQSLSGISDEFATHDDALKNLRRQIEALDGPKAPYPLPVEEDRP